MRWFAATVVTACVIAGANGCSRPHAAAGPVKSPSASTAPSPTEASEKDPAGGAGKFERPDLGVRLEWPEGWAQHKSADFVLLLRPAAKGRADEASATSLSLDVPDLPPHIPGMIPIGSVRNGYLDDLRKSGGGSLKTTDLTPPPLPASAERMVRSVWSDRDGKKWQETALLLVHADRVYIVRGRSIVDDETVTRDTFDRIVRSLAWIKKGSAKG
jgi:hypothetical protein